MFGEQINEKYFSHVNELFLVIWTDVFFFHINNVCPCYPHVQIHRARIKKETFVFYLIYNNVIIVGAGPKLGVFVDDLQGSGHHVLCLLSAAWRLSEHGVEKRKAEGESWCRQWSYFLEKKIIQRNKTAVSAQVLHHHNLLDIVSSA